MSSFRLDPESPPDKTAPRHGGTEGLTVAVLLQNAGWFTRIRWIVVAGLTVFGAAGWMLAPEQLRLCGLRPPGLWPLSLAGALALLNLGSMRWVGYLSRRTPCQWLDVAANIWFQIVSDLVVLTVVVYRVGPTETVIGFAYLFHITLACIFFDRRNSFIVTVLSVLLFLATVGAEYLGLRPHPGILASGLADLPGILPTAIFAVPAVFVWVIMWYLVSSISEAVRQRDRELDAANKRIARADEEINLQMLRVTHDLKAPFSGIESNIQILRLLHWDETPESVRQIVDKIDARSVALRIRIGDILTLGSLRSARAGESVVEPLKLRELLEAVLQDVQSMASDKRVAIDLAAGEALVHSDHKQLKILFLNLVSNAILYSRDGGTVEIGLEEEGLRAVVRVADHGIGISERAMSHVFEDFYRAQEAAAFNPNSTGLGLAIVRQIVRNLGLAIAVESEQDRGTVFKVFIPTR